MANNKEVIYSINIEDLQKVSNRVIGRPLSDAEVDLIGESVGDNIDWFEVIENAIHQHLPE